MSYQSMLFICNIAFIIIVILYNKKGSKTMSDRQEELAFAIVYILLCTLLLFI